MAFVALASWVTYDAIAFSDEQLSPLFMLGWALAMGLTGAFVAARAIAKEARALTVLGWSALGGAVAAAVNMSMGNVSVDATQPTAVALWLFVCAVFAVLGTVVGTIFGASALPMLRAAARANRSSSLDGVERVLLPASLWLALVGWVALRRTREHFPFGVTAIGVAALALAIVAVRDLQRILWLRAVARDRVAGWAIVPDEGGPAPSLPMFAGYDKDALDACLVRRGEGSRGAPFRENGVVEHVARLPLAPRASLAPLALRAAISMLLVIAMLAWLTGSLRAP